LAVFQNPVTVQKELTPWERVQISRKKDRPVAEDYITALFPDFMELHGDRSFGDDHAIIGGVATFHGVPVTVIAQAKGHDTRENIHRNFGMPNPEGYRKALRLMQQAEKFHRPVFCIVDTPGAFCGIEAEQRGQGEAIARNLFEMSSLKTPVVTMVIGEGGSGGALAMAVSDEVWMLENSVYSILSPEGYASILLKDGKLAAKSANMMKMTSKDLLELNVIEQIFEEPEKYTKSSMAGVVHQIEKALIDFLEKSSALTGEELAEKRYERFRNM
jgi:acetyl-CoA carboxylase carboxyl transferase subunit beta